MMDWADPPPPTFSGPETPPHGTVPALFANPALEALVANVAVPALVAFVAFCAFGTVPVTREPWIWPAGVAPPEAIRRSMNPAPPRLCCVEQFGLRYEVSLPSTL